MITNIISTSIPNSIEVSRIQSFEANKEETKKEIFKEKLEDFVREEREVLLMLSQSNTINDKEESNKDNNNQSKKNNNKKVNSHKKNNTSLSMFDVSI